MLSEKDAMRFARKWAQAWNAHDIDRIMAHYADDVVLTSPVAERITGVDRIEGADAVRAYFEKGLAAYPDLRFEIESALPGTKSVIVLYENQAGVRAAEFMELNEAGKVRRMFAHYGGLGEEK